MNFYIDEILKKNTGHCRLGYIVVRNANVQGTSPSLAQKFSQLQTAIAATYNINGLTNVPRLIGVHSLYNQNNFDTSKYKLASEELVQLVLDKKDAYYVNSAVTVMKYCSLRFLLPISLYDLDRIKGDIVYSLPLEGKYVNVSGEIVAADDIPCLSDSHGVFGNHVADTRRTAVTLATKKLLAVVYADEKGTTDELANILDHIGEMIIRYNGGIVDKQEIIEG